VGEGKEHSGFVDDRIEVKKGCQLKSQRKANRVRERTRAQYKCQPHFQNDSQRGFVRELRKKRIKSPKRLNDYFFRVLFVNDPSAGSPTETLLRLLLLLNDKIQNSSSRCTNESAAKLPILQHITQSVGATGGVYKGQGRNQCKLMTCAY
jgi:hypothetical protein